MTKEEFLSYFNILSYDILCQDIEYIDLIGHSKSHITWNKIKDLIDWKGKKVADLGCFHGYYCFKAEEAGAIVTGFERAQIIINTANKLKEAYDSKVEFVKWEAPETIPATYDVAMLLSVLYFFPDKEKAIQNIHCKYLICDVGDDDLDLIKKYYNIINHQESWGIGKRNGIGNLMLCERKS